MSRPQSSLDGGYPFQTVGDCIISPNWTDPQGRASARVLRVVNGVRRRVNWEHQRAWFDAFGYLPEWPGRQLNHTRWHTPGESHPANCINVEHLYDGTPTENALDMLADGTFIGNRYGLKTHCGTRGTSIELNHANTYVMPSGSRGCRACRRAAHQRHRSRVRAT